jgi:menaquinol-cytochrome c reductase iron-sulfur subunit
VSEQPNPETTPRRSFLKNAVGFLSVAMGLALSIPPIAYLLDPLRKRGDGSKQAWSALGSVDNFSLHTPTKIAISGSRKDAWLTETVTLGSAWVIKTSAAPTQFTILSTICPHLGCSIVGDDKAFRCPCHKSRFALDGQRKAGPSPRAMDLLEHEVRDGVLFCRYQRFKTDSAEKTPLDEA